MTVDNDIVGVLCKIPHIITNAEYTAMLYVYSFCYGSATVAVEEYRQRFTMPRIPVHRLFYIELNILRDCGALPSAHNIFEWLRNSMWRNSKIFLKW